MDFDPDFIRLLALQELYVATGRAFGDPVMDSAAKAAQQNLWDELRAVRLRLFQKYADGRA